MTEAMPVKHNDAIIRVESLGYQVEDTAILTGISFEVLTGEVFGVMGMSGSGKSTLLRCLMGLVRTSSGAVEIDGEVMTGKTEDQLNTVRARMGMCFQGAALFDSMTVAENLAFGLQRDRQLSAQEIAGRVAEHLKIINLEGFGDYMPADLSGGMRKRVGIARALIMRPKIILYDEPTSGLDPITAGQINALISRLRDEFGTTSVVVTHEVDRLFAIADRVLMIDRKTVAACDTPENLLCSEDEGVRQFIAGDIHGPIDTCVPMPGIAAVE